MDHSGLLIYLHLGDKVEGELCEAEVHRVIWQALGEEVLATGSNKHILPHA